MALAQRPDLLLLDEPTAFLDIAHQFELLDLLSRLTDEGVTIVISMHDLWLTAIYCQRVIAMRDGKIAANGPASEVLTPELIRDVFGVDVAVREHPTSNARIALPIARLQADPDRATAPRPAAHEEEPSR
jgi:iron complex transport system ATP-binding protein